MVPKIFFSSLALNLTVSNVADPVHIITLNTALGTDLYRLI